MVKKKDSPEVEFAVLSAMSRAGATFEALSNSVRTKIAASIETGMLNEPSSSSGLKL